MSVRKAPNDCECVCQNTNASASMGMKNVVVWTLMLLQHSHPFANVSVVFMCKMTRMCAYRKRMALKQSQIDAFAWTWKSPQVVIDEVSSLFEKSNEQRECDSIIYILRDMYRIHVTAIKFIQLEPYYISTQPRFQTNITQTINLCDIKFSIANQHL